MSKKLSASLVMLMVGCSIWVESSLSAQEGDAASKAEAKAAFRISAASRRVPPYFGQVGLTIEQREKIYEIRARHQVKVAELRQQLEEVVKQEMAECEAVLTEAQRSLLRQRRDARKFRTESDLEAPAGDVKASD